MRASFGVTFAIGIGFTFLGCSKPFDGPTVKAFTGKVTHQGKPVSFAENEISLKLFHEKGQSFGIPIQTDGSFKIGWMPIGKYSVMVERAPQSGQKGAGQKYSVPGGLAIEDGKTEYTIELGDGWKY